MMASEKHKFKSTGIHGDSNIPSLEQAYSRNYSHEDKIAALAKFVQQISSHFPEILNSDRDRTASNIHIANIEEQLNRPKQDMQVIQNSLQGLLKIGDKKQDDMLACALLDYIDEMIEMISTKQ